VDNFIETRFPQYFDFFKRLDTRIQQIDFFRLCALYHHGGFYLDLDMYPIKNLAPLCSVNRFIIPVEHHLPSGKCQRFQKYGRYPDFDCKKRVTLGNYALASPAQNPELLTLIQTIVNDYVKVDRSKYHRLVHVYITTGPDKLTQVYSTNQHFANKIYLLPNNHSTAYFGNFAKHLAAGSWK
jgi:mannosyltransferase OCH1-like enzyme